MDTIEFTCYDDLISYAYDHDYQIFFTLNWVGDIPNAITYLDDHEVLIYDDFYYIEILDLNEREKAYFKTFLNKSASVVTKPKKLRET